MEFAINMVDATKLCEVLKASGDNRTASAFMDFYKGKENNRFVAFAPGYLYSKAKGYFNIHGNAVLAEKGTRPNCNERYRSTSPAIIYLIRFTDGEVRICSEALAYDTPITSRTGVVIGASDENIQYMFVGCFGAGGGGSGGNAITSGVGGASGGAVFGCLALEHNNSNLPINTIPFTIGAGGNSVTGHNTGGNGGDSGLIVGGGSFIGAGGNGADSGNVGQPRASVNDGISFLIPLGVTNGAAGGGEDSSGKAVPITGTQNYAPEGENSSISYGGFSNSADGRGGGGGNGPLGKGGNGPSGAGSGGNAGGITGGGSGGNFKAFGTTSSGKGGNGCVIIYY